jgi:hypothetical protein
MLRLSADRLQRFETCVVAVAATSILATALAAEAAADHDTVGGGTFAVSNSDGPCTAVTADSTPYTLCSGGWINLAESAKYIIVPLGPHISVACNTYAPDGSLFEHDDENLAEVPRKQRFWAEQGWGA